jgi:hypothetical protein
MVMMQIIMDTTFGNIKPKNPPILPHHNAIARLSFIPNVGIKSTVPIKKLSNPVMIKSTEKARALTLICLNNSGFMCDILVHITLYSMSQ